MTVTISRTLSYKGRSWDARSILRLIEEENCKSPLSRALIIRAEAEKLVTLDELKQRARWIVAALREWRRDADVRDYLIGILCSDPIMGSHEPLEHDQDVDQPPQPGRYTVKRGWGLDAESGLLWHRSGMVTIGSTTALMLRCIMHGEPRMINAALICERAGIKTDHPTFYVRTHMDQLRTKLAQAKMMCPFTQNKHGSYEFLP